MLLRTKKSICIPIKHFQCKNNFERLLKSFMQMQHSIHKKNFLKTEIKFSCLEEVPYVL